MTLQRHALAEALGVSYTYGAKSTTNFWLPCDSHCNVDISFSYSAKSAIGTLFRLRERIQITPRLYCYGRGAASAANIIKSDGELTLSLERIVGAAVRVHWTATQFSAVDVAGSIEFDGMGGRRFLSDLKVAADKLAQVDPALIHSNPAVDTIQPGRLFLILLALLFAGGVPMCVYMIANSMAK